MGITADIVKSKIIQRGIEDCVTTALEIDRVEDEELRELLFAARLAIRAVDAWFCSRYGNDYAWE